MAHSDQLSRWLLRLADLTELMLPTDYPRPVPIRTVEAELVVDISEPTAMAIMQLSIAAQANNPHSLDEMVSPFTILLAAFSVLLHRYTGEQDITIGSSSSTSNPLVLRTAIQDSDSFVHVMAAVQQVSLSYITDRIVSYSTNTRSACWSVD